MNQFGKNKEKITFLIVEKVESFAKLLVGIRDRIHIFKQIDKNNYIATNNEDYSYCYDIAMRIIWKVCFRHERDEYDAVPFLPHEMNDFLMLIDMISRNIINSKDQSDRVFLQLSELFFNSWKQKWNYNAPKDLKEFQDMYSEINKLRK
ncbi:MAG: hypothetical protein WCT85_07370 [Parachlamydiales bacterium]|jgi:hypothetical protein